MQLQLIFVVFITLALVLLAVQNPNPIQLKFIAWQTGQLSQSIIILISVLIGTIISFVFGLFTQLKLKNQIKVLEMELDHLNQEIEDEISDQ